MPELTRKRGLARLIVSSPVSLPGHSEGMELHPAAELFPLMSDAQIDELAADIKAHGLLQPIVITDGLLLDGRNRVAACQRAGVEPRSEELTGSDPWVYAIAANAQRRHLNASQRAIVAARALPHFKEQAQARQSSGQKLPKGSGGKATDVAGRAFRVSGEYVRMAAHLLKKYPKRVADIMAGRKYWESTSIVTEYRSATVASRYMKKVMAQRKADKKSEETTKHRAEYADTMLRAQVAIVAPADIREQVELGIIEPDEAIERMDDRRDRATGIYNLARQMLMYVDSAADVETLAVDIATAYDPTDTPDGYTPATFRRAGETLTRIADTWEEMS